MTEMNNKDTEAIWEQALQLLQWMKMSTYALLSQHGHLRQISDREVHIGIVNQTLLNLTIRSQDKIEAAFSQVLGRPINVAFEIAPLPRKVKPVPKTKGSPQSAVVSPSSDPVREAAEKLARFFNGVVIRLPDEGENSLAI